MQKDLLFGFTAKAWREANPELAKNSNIRDYSSINELTVLSNLESHNAQMIRKIKRREIYDIKGNCGISDKNIK